MSNLKIEEAMKMSKREIECELGKRAKKLEELGMDHVSACEFLSDIMNLGIAVQKKVKS